MNQAWVILVATVFLATLGTTIELSYADSDTPPFVPDECEDYSPQDSTKHFLRVDSLGDDLQGDPIRVVAGTTDSGTGAGRVHIVAIMEDTTVFHDNVLLLPSPYGNVSEVFNIPGDAPFGATIVIYACFESPGSLQEVGVTHHLNTRTFFVLPESSFGAVALIGSSLAALGGFMLFKGRQSNAGAL
jgi:hypothetical protein